MADRSLADVLLLLTQTTGKLSEQIAAPKDKGTSDKSKKAPENVKNFLGSNIRQNPKQEKVVKELIPMSLDDIGVKALRKIKSLIPTAKPIKKEQAIKEESGFMKFIKGLIGPALLILSGIAALIMGFLNDGPLKGLLTLLGKGGILGGIKWLTSILFKKFSGIFKFIKKLIPVEAIEKVFISLKKAFKWVGSKIFSGMKFVWSKIKSIIPVNFFKKIFGPLKEGFAKLTSGLLKPFIGISKGLGKGLFSKILGGATKLLKPLLKRLPGIGSLIDWYSAYTRFKKGDIVGGLIDVASGIASMIPGVGTALSVGLGVLNAFLDYKAGGSDVAGGKAKPKGVMLVDFFKKIKNKLVLGLWNMIPDFEIFGVSVKGKLASMMGLDIPGIEAEIAKSEAEEKAAAEQLKIEKAKAEKEDTDKPTDQASPNQTPFPNNIDFNDPNENPNLDPFPDDIDDDINSNNYESVDSGVDSSSEDLAMLKQATDQSNSLLSKQLEILNESKKILAELSNKLSNMNSGNNSVVSSKNTVTNIFQQSSIRDLQQAYT